jgi:hypothetical protein
MINVSFSLIDDDLQAVENCTISIYDSLYNLVFQEFSATGVVSNVQLPVGEYYARVYSTTSTFSTHMFNLDGTFLSCSYNIVGSTNVIDVPSDARFCKVYGRVVGPNLLPISGLSISVSAESGYICEDDLVISTYANVNTDKNGYLEMILRRNSSYIITGLPYINYIDEDLPVSVYITIPDRPSCKLIDVLAPIPLTIQPSFVETSSGSVSIIPDITMTDGTKLLQNLKNCIEVKSDTLSINVGNVDITISEVPIGTHEINFYAKTFKPKSEVGSGPFKRPGLPKLVGKCTIQSI